MSGKPTLKVTYEVKVIKPDGSVRSQFTKTVEHPIPDMILIQFRDLLAFLLRARSTETIGLNLTDTGGVSRSVYFRGNGASYRLFNDIQGGAVGGRIAIGSDGTAPARNQYTLISEIAEFDITFEQTTDTSITKQGAWLATASGTVREVGFILYMQDTSGAVRRFLIFRDTPTPQAYETNDSVQVTYTINI